VINAIYELPFKGNRLVEGWQLSTIVQEQSGNPVNIVAGSPAAIGAIPGVNINALTGLATLRPDLIGPIDQIGNVNPWFSNTVCDPRNPAGCPTGSVFALPVAFTGGKNVLHFGSMGRNVVIGPGFNNVDFSVIKNTKINESVRVQFRAE